ncbi:hypothetical protein D4764_13G0000220 [Takifugu flavidus]|uniref:Integrase catalytic domain-containing protein n=1 Tax=Takifugu flavidus TaxID=433684 RepID=A0A5C6PAR6_9TELE|nr:hypothetical protein D4764_13G0000220 [Takifugu flavidus]
MDPAEPPSPRDRFERIEGVLMLHEQRLEEAAAHARQAAEAQARAITALTAQLQQLTSTLSSPEATNPRLEAPERYNGDPKLCRPFLTSCSLLFSLQPHTFATEGAKVAYVISNLTGRAILWGTAEWERQNPACASFQAFSEVLRKVFGLGATGPDGTSGLLSIRQGNQSVADYSIDFRTKARQSDWNLAALRDAFLHGLAEYIKDELVSYPLPATLDELIELSTRLDLRVRARRRERTARDRRQNPAPSTAAHRLNFPSASAPVPADPEPMQLGRTRLTPEERQRRQMGNLSMYCRQVWTFYLSLSVKRQSSPVNEEVLVSHVGVKSSSQIKRPVFLAKLLLADDSHTLATFIDSGSDGNIMDKGLAMQLGLERIPLNPPIPARALDGHLLGTVAHQTAPVHMLISGNHHETIQFHLLPSSNIPLILGFPWLRKHNPHVDWTTATIPSWSGFCHQCAYGYQPPLFPALEKEASCPSVQAFLHRCHWTWARARASLLKTAGRYSSAANRRRSQAPEYQVGQKSGSSRVHPTFHVSKVKPVRESPLVPAAPPPPPPRFIDGGLTYAVRRIIRSRVRGRGLHIQISPLTAWSGVFLIEGCVLSALLLLQLLSQRRIPGLDFSAMVADQSGDPEIRALESTGTGLKLEKAVVQDGSPTLLCDVSTGRPRPVVPVAWRHRVFDMVHSLSHPGVRASVKLHAKVHQHTMAPLETFAIPARRFDHMHVDLVGPLPPSHGYTHLLTMVDRTTRWPEVVPLSSTISADVARAFLSAWVARFGSPSDITSDRGPQFVSKLWSSMARSLGTQVHRTTAYHPQANGLCERFHRSLKAALRAALSDDSWVDRLPWVMLGLCSAPKEDLDASPVELVLGQPLRVPGEFLLESAPPCNFPARSSFSAGPALVPSPVLHCFPQSFVPTDLATARFVFVRHDAHRSPLRPPYDGPFRVLETGAKSFVLDMGGRSERVTLDRLKPAHLLVGQDVLPTQVPRRGHPPKVQNVPSDDLCSNLQPAVDFVSPACDSSAFPEEGRRSRYGRLIKPPVRD